MLNLSLLNESMALFDLGDFLVLLSFSSYCCSCFSQYITRLRLRSNVAYCVARLRSAIAKLSMVTAMETYGIKEESQRSKPVRVRETDCGYSRVQKFRIHAA